MLIAYLGVIDGVFQRLGYTHVALSMGSSVTWLAQHVNRVAPHPRCSNSPEAASLSATMRVCTLTCHHAAMAQQRAVKVRMKDVAEHAGVSIRTVSNVVNNFEHVSAQMRQLVQRSVDELGYQMDYVARGLRSGRTGFIALVVPNLSEPYFAELAEAVIRAAQRKHLIVLIEATGGDPDVEMAIMKGALAAVADGVLLSSVAATIKGAPEGPVVMLGEHAATTEMQHVGIDNVAAARIVVEHLIDQGYRRIAALGVQDTDTARLRYEGFKVALTAAGLKETSSMETTGSVWSPQSGYDAVSRMLKRTTRLPDAIFAFNDSLAIGALRALQERHISVPGEVALAGIDNITQSAFVSPPLTSIAPDLDELAGRALDLLEDQLVGQVRQRFTPTLTSFRLIVRASSQAL